MRTKRTLLAAGVAATAMLTLSMTSAAPAASADASSAVVPTTVDFMVNLATSPPTPCTVNADVYVPADAGPTHQVPAMILAHGFGADKNMMTGLAKWFAANDYAVVNYTNIGAVSSACPTGMADPAYEGAVAKTIVDYLGGDPIPVYTTASNDSLPAPSMSGIILHDAADHDGLARPDDPRVGMLGVSLGGGTTFATASIDHRIDTIIPAATWNDLAYSLGPQDGDLASPSDLVSTTPGVAKTSWGILFDLAFLEKPFGTVNLAQTLSCPVDAIGTLCADMNTSLLQGYGTPAAAAELAAHSVASYSSKIVVPTLLIAGEDDDLFNLKESTASYAMLKNQGVTVKTIWASGNHGGGLAPGDFQLANPSTSQYVAKRLLDWTDHYLKGDATADPGPDFAYLQPWLVGRNLPANPTQADLDASTTAAYATSDSMTIPSVPHTWYLASGGTLNDNAATLTGDTQAFMSEGTTQLATLGDDITWLTSPTNGYFPDSNAPLAASQYQTPALTSALDVVGEPTVDVRILAPFAAANTAKSGAGGMVVLYAKLYDVGPDGTSTLVNNQSAPFRISDTTKPVHVVMPPITHRFAAGHQIKLMITGYDTRYGGTQVNTVVAIGSGTADQGLTLPVVP